MSSTRSQNPTCRTNRDKGGGTDDFMDIADWRKKIDELDEKLVELLSERAQAALRLGS